MSEITSHLSLLEQSLNNIHFGVSTAIVNTIYIFRRWYKLNFGPLQVQVRPHHFSDKDRRKNTIFLIFIQMSWNNWQ